MSNMKNKLLMSRLFEPISSKAMSFDQNASHLFYRKNKWKSISVFITLMLLAPFVMAQTFSEDFENGIPNDWGLFRDGNATIDWQLDSDGYQSNAAAFLNPAIDNIGSGNSAGYYLVSPSISLPRNAQIHFMSKHNSIGDANTVFTVMIATAAQPDINDFIPLESWNAADVVDFLSYKRRIIDLSSLGEGTEVYIAFVVDNIQSGALASGISWTVDDVMIITACDPVDPDGVDFINITTSSADITWDHPTSTYFELQVIESGEVLVENNGVSVNSHSYHVNNLEPETEYDVYIRTICTGDIPSEWLYVGSFQSMKFGMSCDEPVVIDEDHYFLATNINEFPNIATDYYPQNGTNCFSSAVSENYLAGNKIYFSYTAPQNGVINIEQMTLPWTPGTTCWGNPQSAVFIYEDCSNVGVECLAALRTTNVSDPQYIRNFPVDAGNTYIIVIGTFFNTIDASVCFEFTFDFDSCTKPDEIKYTELLQNSVNFSWNNPLNLAIEWEYLVLPASDAPPTATSNGISTTTHHNLHITGLDVDTEYKFYVRSSCDGSTFGEWNDGYPFRTQCGAFNLPYYTGFQGRTTTGNNPEPCWTIINIDGGRAWEFMQDHVSLWAGDNYNFNHDYLISPQIDLGSSSLPKKLRFKQQIVGWDNPVFSYSIMASTTGLGIDNFTEVILPETVITESSGWEEVTFDIPSHITGQVNIAWIVSPVGSGQTANRLSFTDVYVFEECNVPTNLSVVDVTETSAHLTWTPSSTGDSEWEVLILPRGSARPTTQNTGTLVGTYDYWAENLIHSTRYEYYVRTSCSSTAKSDWVGPVEFFTLCEPVAEPYHETFDLDMDPIHPNNPDTKRYCWAILDENNDGQTWSLTNTTAIINLNVNGNDDWLISPAIDLDGDFHEFTFLHRGSEVYDLEVLISDSGLDIQDFTPLISFEANSAGNSYHTAQHYFSAIGEVYLAIRVSPVFNAINNTTITIDDFKIRATSSCPNPIDIQRDAATNTFTWTPGNTETQWEVVLLDASQNIPRNGIIVNSPSYTLTDVLDEGAVYKFFVRAICDVNKSSEWTGPYRFVTECTQVFTTPFIETFEMDSGSVNCWNANAWMVNNALNPYEGKYSAIVYTWGSDSDRWLISPAIDVEEGSMLSFYYKASQYAPEYSEDLKVWLSTTGNTKADFTTLLFEDYDFQNIGYIQASTELPAGVSGQVYIAFEIPTQITNIYGWRSNVFIDNIEVKLIPDCPEPYNIEVINLQDTQFDLYFDTLGNVAEWEVLVLPYATEDPFNNIDPNNLYKINSNPGTISGLNPATAYDVYIRPVCATSNIGEWSDLIPVVTLCGLENRCLYTITLFGGESNTQGVGGGIDVIQNGYVVQTLQFPGNAPWYQIMEPIDYQVYLCDGVEFTLHWASFGWAPNQYPNAYVKVTDSNGVEVWMSEMGIGKPKSDIYSGLASCSEITCAQPTDLVVSELGDLSWTPGGNETQWEVYIQPYGLGALPTEGVIVNQNSYTPTEADLIHGANGIYEFFVRAICAEDDTSFWTGPEVYLINDDSSTALVVPVNSDDECVESLDNLTFLGSTPSSDGLSLDLPRNSGDIWVEFEATSETLSIQVDNFSGRHNDAGYSELPRIIMILYKDNGGILEEIGWSDNNVLYTMYSSELEIGELYKVRLINTNPEIPNTRSFSMCITTIEACTVDAPNYSFENPGMVSSYTVDMMYFDNVIPGWRDNSRVLTGTIFFWGTHNDFARAYDGGQFVQVPFQDEDGIPEPNPNGDSSVRGLYQDFDSSEITQFDYSFAYLRRGSGTRIIQLWAGSVDGPFKLVTENSTSDVNWHHVFGKYDVPEGQDRTRFIFRTKNKVGALVLDAANFVAFNGIVSSNHILTCANPEADLRAVGYGEWTASEDNPAEVFIEDATSNDTMVYGFAVPGEYVFYWNTRYCQDSVTITYEGIEELPEVESPVEYCLGDDATSLVASELAGFELVFYTQQFGGTGVSNIIPDTSESGVTTYYVAYVDADGCEGGRVPIEVIVHELAETVVAFEYNEETYCPYSDNPAPVFAEGFTYGGVFSSTPEGLSIDSDSGVVFIESSQPGIYEITYSLDEDTEICQMSDSYSVAFEVIESFSFSLYNFCEAGRYMLGVEFISKTPETARYTWTSTSGSVLGTSNTLDLVAAFQGNVELPTRLSLTIEVGDCAFTEDILVESALCEIPKGISPNGDGLNDSFDLSGLSVDKITIFNRYGTKVYSKSNYTKEWYGQSDKGKDLPDGTYYYSIRTKSGESITGWVYLNRAH